MKFTMSRAKDIAGKLRNHPRVKRLGGWLRRRDFTLYLAVGAIALFSLFGLAINDFLNVAKQKDQQHQESMLRGQLAEFLLSTREPDGSSLLENPQEFTKANRQARVVSLRRSFFTYFLTKSNVRSFQPDDIRFESPRACSLEYPVEQIGRPEAQRNVMHACFGAVPNDPSGRYVYFSLRYPASAITRHKTGQPLSDSDRVTLNFSGLRAAKLVLVFEPSPITQSRNRPAQKRFDRFHEVAGFLNDDVGRPTRAVQGQAFERATENSMGNVTIVGRIDASILPGFGDAEKWPSQGIKNNQIGVEVTSVAKGNGAVLKPYGFAPGAAGKAVMSLEQAYLSAVPSRANLAVAYGTDTNVRELWHSNQLEVAQAARPPGFFQIVSDKIAELAVKGGNPVKVQQQQQVAGLPRMTATLTADEIVLPDIAARAFLWMIALLVVLLFVSVVAAISLSKLDRLTRAASAIAKVHRTRGFEQYLRSRDQIGTLGRAMHVLFHRDQNRLARLRKHLEREDTARKIALARDVERLQLRQQTLLAIGHEIRSPLGNLLARTDLDDMQHTNLERMRRSIDALYEAAKIEEGLKNGSIVVSAMDLAQFVSSFARNLHADGAPVVAVGPQSGVMALYDEIMLGHHLEHVIKNALSYATPETNVEIRLRESPGQAIVDVFNYGPLIADTREIFTLGVSDRPSPEHMGLGLYAARIHILEMGGDIHAENREGGVAFVITLSTPTKKKAAEQFTPGE